MRTTFQESADPRDSTPVLANARVRVTPRGETAVVRYPRRQQGNDDVEDALVECANGIAITEGRGVKVDMRAVQCSHRRIAGDIRRIDASLSTAHTRRRVHDANM